MYAFPFGSVEKTCLKTKSAATSRKNLSTETKRKKTVLIMNN